MKELNCPNCNTLTVRDENNCYERCLNCRWVRKIQPDDFRLKQIGVIYGGDLPELSK